jgi:hypothetical protein
LSNYFRGLKSEAFPHHPKLSRTIRKLSQGILKLRQAILKLSQGISGLMLLSIDVEINVDP